MSLEQDLLKQYEAFSSEEQAQRNEWLSSLPREQKQLILAALTAKLKVSAQQQQQQQQQYPPPRLGYADVGANDGDDFDDYEDDLDDDLEDEYDDELENFEKELLGAAAANHSITSSSSSTAAWNSPTGPSSSAGRELFTTATIVTDPFARRQEIGDFELLRLAKMGDCVSFKEFEVMSQQQQGVQTFFDNNNRDALHYAADGGSMELIRYLVEEKRMVLRSDDKLKATPLDVAVLLQRDDVVSYLKSKFPKDAKSFAEALEAFAPPPPRFCLSKAAPIAACEKRSRVFWSDAPVVPSLLHPGVQYNAETLDGSCSGVLGTVVAMVNRSNTGEHHGLDNWTFPLDADHAQAILPRSVVVGVTAVNSADGSVQPAAVGIAAPLGAQVVVTVALTPLKQDTLQNVYQCGCFNVALSHQKQGIHAILMTHMRKTLASRNAGAAVFRSRHRLPIQPACSVKWFRRSIRPMKVFPHLLACSEVYPDFYAYDDRLRVDWVAKETLGQADQSPTLTSWVAATKENAEVAAQCIASSLAALLKKAGAEIFTPFATAECVTTSILGADLQTYFIPSADGKAITDLVVLRIRQSRERAAGASGSSALRCAVSVFSVFSTIAGEKRVMEQLLMAKELGCDVFLASNLCGLTDSDFSKAKFEEIESYREYAYVVKPRQGAGPAAWPATCTNASTSAAKVYLPLALL